MPHETVQTYDKLPNELTIFLTNLTKAVKDNPNLGFDLSNAVHTGFFRLIDVKYKNGSEIKPGQRIYNASEKGPDDKPIPVDYYSASESYAFAPGWTADPEGTEKGEQIPFKIYPNGSVETKLTVEELNNLFSYAKKGLLCVTPPNISLVTANVDPGYVIQSDANGKVDLNLISDSYKQRPEERTDAQKLIVQGIDAISRQNSAKFFAFMDEDRGQEKAVANSAFTSMYWAAKYLE